MDAQEQLFAWLQVRLSPPACAWLRDRCAALARGAPEREFFLAFSQAVRHAGKNLLALNPGEQQQAAALRPGWDLRDWTADQAARAALLLALPPGSKTVAAILSLHQSADLGEHVALACALFLPADAKALIHIAREAIRSNMRDVFAAISQRNPYPAEHCDDIAWNQMVAKCLFVDLPLRTIAGLDRRANAALAAMLVDLAAERRAAHRSFSPEAWRCVAPFAKDAAIAAMEKALDGSPAERRGAALGLWAAGAGGREAVARKAADLRPALEAGTLNWENFDHV